MIWIGEFQASRTEPKEKFKWEIVIKYVRFYERMRLRGVQHIMKHLSFSRVFSIFFTPLLRMAQFSENCVPAEHCFCFTLSPLFEMKIKIAKKNLACSPKWGRVIWML